MVLFHSNSMLINLMSVTYVIKRQHGKFFEYDASTATVYVFK